MTQTQLAGNRYSKSYVSIIESGRARPSAQALDFFAAQLDKPVEYFRRDQSTQASTLRSLLAAAQACIRRRDFAAAEERLRQTAVLAMALDDPAHLGRVHDIAGHLFVATGDLQSAIMAFREAITVYAAAGAMDSVAAARCSLANAFFLSGDMKAALAETKAAQDVYAGLEPNHLVLGRSYLLGGNVASATGCHEAARRCFEQALSLMAGRDVLGLGETHAALGFHALRRGEWEEARGGFQEALRILEGVGDFHFLSVITRHLSEALFRCGDLQHAADMTRRSGSLSASIGDQHGVVWATVRLAELSLPAGDLPTARAAVAEARNLLKQPAQASEGSGPESEVEAEATQRLLGARVCRAAAGLSHRDGDVDSAMRHLRTAIDLLAGWQAGVGMHIGLCRQLAALLWGAGRHDDAVLYYELGLTTAENAQPREAAGPDPVRELARMPSPLWFRS